MTHFERIHAAMRHQEPDRVPVMCQLSQGYMSKNGGEKPFDMYFNAESAARAFFKTREELDFDGKGGFVNVITVDVEEYAKSHFEKSVKKTLTIPAWLNQAALAQNINFSQVLQEGLKARLHLR